MFQMAAVMKAPHSSDDTATKLSRQTNHPAATMASQAQSDNNQPRIRQVTSSRTQITS